MMSALMYGLFRCNLEVDQKDQLANGKVRLVKPIWNGMVTQLRIRGYEPEVKDGKIYIQVDNGRW